MATATSRVGLLLRSVRRLPPAQRREFTRRLIGTTRRNGSRAAKSDPADDALIETIKLKLSRRELARMRRFGDRCSLGTLTATERAEYMSLIAKADRMSLLRIQAIAELARRRGKSVRAMIDEVGWESPNDD
jgi:hypothetical protein